MNWIQWISLLLFLGVFVAIFTEKIHRTIVAVFGAMLMLLLGFVGDFYHQEDAFRAIDFNTILLLLWMMLVVAMLEKSGYLEYLAVRMAQQAKGHPWRLLLFLGSITTFVSMMLDNVTTVVVIGPVTVSICRVLQINPIPFLLAEALLSNTGGVATLIGDPPNIIIGSAAGFTFNEFLIHLGPIVLVAWLVCLFLIWRLFREDLSRPSERLEELMRIDPGEHLRDWPTARRVLIVLGGVLILFFLHGQLHLAPSTVAFIGFAVAFTWIRPHPDEILKMIDWSVLLFFSALFALVGGLEHSGVLDLLGELLVAPAEANLLLASILLLWVAAFASAVVDNIPFTIAMVPIIKHLESQGLVVEPLWWALAMGAGFGGNGTPIGSTANVVIVSLSERAGHPIGFPFWIRTGGLIMVAILVVSTGLFVLLSEILGGT